MDQHDEDSSDGPPSPQLGRGLEAHLPLAEDVKPEIKPEPDFDGASNEPQSSEEQSTSSGLTRRRSVKNKERFSPEPASKKASLKHGKGKSAGPVSTSSGARAPPQLAGRKTEMTFDDAQLEHIARIPFREFCLPERWAMLNDTPSRASSVSTSVGDLSSIGSKNQPEPRVKPTPTPKEQTKKEPLATPTSKTLRLNLTKLAQKKGTLPVNTVSVAAASGAVAAMSQRGKAAAPSVASLTRNPAIEEPLKIEPELKEEALDSVSSEPQEPAVSSSTAAVGVGLSAATSTGRSRRDRKQRKEYSPEPASRPAAVVTNRAQKETTKQRDQHVKEPKEEDGASSSFASQAVDAQRLYHAAEDSCPMPRQAQSSTVPARKRKRESTDGPQSSGPTTPGTSDKPEPKRVRLTEEAVEVPKTEPTEPLSVAIPLTPSARARTVSTASSNLESPRTPASDRPRRNTRPPRSKEFSPDWKGAGALYAGRSPQTPSMRATWSPSTQEPKPMQLATLSTQSIATLHQFPAVMSDIPTEEDFASPSPGPSVTEMQYDADDIKPADAGLPRAADAAGKARLKPLKPLTVKISADARKESTASMSLATPMTSEAFEASRSGGVSALPRTPAEWLASAPKECVVEANAVADTIATSRTSRNKSVPIWQLVQGLQSRMVLEDIDTEAKKKKMRKPKPAGPTRSLEGSFETTADYSAASDNFIDVGQSIALDERPQTPASRLSMYEPDEEPESTDDEPEEAEPSDEEFQPDEPAVVIRKPQKKRGRPSAAAMKRRATIGDLDRPLRVERGGSIALSIPSYSGRGSPVDSAAHTPTSYQPTRRYSAYDVLDEGRKTRFSDMVRRRRQLNPLAVGLDRSGENLFRKDYFYREVLMRDSKSDDARSADSEEEIDVGDGDSQAVQQPRQEVISTLPAEQCANDILEILRSWKPSQIALTTLSEAADADDADPENVESIRKRAESLPPLVQSTIKSILDRVMLQRLVDAASISTESVSVDGGCSMHYAKSIQNASRLRESLLLYSKERKDAVCRAHLWLLENLPQPLLASYLNLLRFLKVAGSSLSDLVAHPKPEMGSHPQIDAAVRDFLATKITESPGNNDLLDIERLQNVSVLLVYPSIITRIYRPRYRAHDTMFRHLLPSVVQVVEKLELNLDVEEISIELMVQKCVDKIRESVRGLVKRRPHDHALLDVGGVSGLLNFAFPLIGADNRCRGSVDDDMCLTYCPSLYVVGEHATDVELNLMQRLRRNMICDTGLVVVGGADRNLYVSPTVLATERVSQRCVDRTVLGHVVDFMRKVTQESGMDAQELRKLLKPVTMPNVYEVDPSMLKAKSTGGGGGASVATGGPQMPPKPKKISDVRPPVPQMPAPQPPVTTHMESARMRSGTFPTRPHPGPSSLLRTAQSASTDSPNSLFSARTALDATLRGGPRVVSSISSDIRLPTPQALNRQLPPPIEAIREEDAAAASLSFDTFNQAAQDDPFANEYDGLML